MTFDPNELRDKSGKWTSGASSGAKSAVEWLKSGEAKAAIAKLSAPENIKQAAVMAIQGALFKIGVNDPHIDQVISHQVKTFANDVKVTRAHARQLMLTAVKALKKVKT
jgi:3-oxoacyl-(acyl-carrier-protein) synthase